MDEITLVNLLNKICEKNDLLEWKLNCNYQDGMDTSIMEISLFNPKLRKKLGSITFKMETGTVIDGKYGGLLAFNKYTSLLDALLDILHYENTKLVTSVN